MTPGIPTTGLSSALSAPAGNPETGYTNVGDGPTQQNMLSNFNDLFRLSFGKRPPQELYLVDQDPDCMKNVASDLKYSQAKRRRRERMPGRADFFETIEYTGPSKHSYANWLKYNKTPQ